LRVVKMSKFEDVTVNNCELELGGILKFWGFKPRLRSYSNSQIQRVAESAYADSAECVFVCVYCLLRSSAVRLRACTCLCYCMCV